MMEEKRRTRTIHVVRCDGMVGHITAAYEFKNEGILHVALAFCSPKDHFSRKIGKMIALGRLDKERKHGRIELLHDKSKTILDNIRQAVVQFAEMSDIHWMEGVLPNDLV